MKNQAKDEYYEEDVVELISHDHESIKRLKELHEQTYNDKDVKRRRKKTKKAEVIIANPFDVSLLEQHNYPNQNEISSVDEPRIIDRTVKRNSKSLKL